MEMERITVKAGSAIPELNNGLSTSFDLSFLNTDVMYQPPQVPAAMMGYALDLGPVIAPYLHRLLWSVSCNQYR